MADVKISELPVGATLTGTEEIPMTQSGATVKMTAQDIADLATPMAGVSSVVAGTGISVDNTDPSNPIISATGGGGGIPDAPSDGNIYGRKDGDWEQVPGSSGGSDVIAVQTPANVSGTVTLDFDSKSQYVGTITLGANVTTLAFSNLPGAGNYSEYELHIMQDATGSRTFALPASHRALGGSDTAIAAAANAVTVLSASTVDNGTTWRYAMQESA